ncbi:MAG TPA: FeoB-associated Cys-rich membrane protein [Balneolaceae bacterium]|nr:FeoB-associated Cys-rich membrane protein [Balneolaceae bacterium]
MQTIIAIALLAAAIGYLGWKFVGKKLAKSKDKTGCGPDCNCS